MATLSDPHPSVLTDRNGATLDIVTSAPSAGQPGLTVYPVPSASVAPTQDSADGATGATAPADAIQAGGADPTGKLQALQMAAAKLLLNAEQGAANFSVGQATVSTATQIVAIRATRRAVAIINTHATATLYIGPSTVTTSSGLPLPAGQSASVPTTAAVYGVASTGSLTAGFVEVYD